MGISGDSRHPGFGCVIRADEAVKDAVFERRSCGTGTKGPRRRTGRWRHGQPTAFLLIRRLISRPDQLTSTCATRRRDGPATMTYFIAIAGRRWPVEETFKTGKDVLGWDQCQARTWDAAAGTPPCPRSPSSARAPSATPCAA